MEVQYTDSQYLVSQVYFVISLELMNTNGFRKALLQLFVKCYDGNIPILVVNSAQANGVLLPFSLHA